MQKSYRSAGDGLALGHRALHFSIGADASRTQARLKLLPVTKLSALPATRAWKKHTHRILPHYKLQLNYSIRYSRIREHMYFPGYMLHSEAYLLIWQGRQLLGDPKPARAPMGATNLAQTTCLSYEQWQGAATSTVSPSLKRPLEPNLSLPSLSLIRVQREKQWWTVVTVIS